MDLFSIGPVDQLTDDVIEQLLNLTLLDDPYMDKNAHAALHNASMLALVLHQLQVILQAYSLC